MPPPPPPPPPPSAVRPSVQPGGTRTQTITEAPAPPLTTQRYVTLVLRGFTTDTDTIPTTGTTGPGTTTDGDQDGHDGRRRRRIHWAEDAVNNEGMNRKKSK
ncbi:MAG: hypothetical protein M1823_001312, partial [Watsoniomyces obsoletus]